MSQKKYRRRRRESGEEGEDEEETPVSEKLSEARELQSTRKRQSGVSAIRLAYGKKCSEEEERLAPDPFKLKTGGLVNLKEITNEDVQGTEDEVVKRLASQFSAETQTRDDETHMMRYIDDKMAELKGKDTDEKQLTDYEAKVVSLYQIPDRLKTKEKTQSEEMLSNQMLSGIPEVDLGLEAKFKNIEQTEGAKQRVIKEKLVKRGKTITMAPRNMASNYTLHSLRFYSDKAKHPKEEETTTTTTKPKLVYIPVVGSHDEPELKASVTVESTKRKPDHSQMASDDYHYDKFKKKVRRF